VTDGQTDEQTELRWLRRTKAVAASASKNGAKKESSLTSAVHRDDFCGFVFSYEACVLQKQQSCTKTQKTTMMGTEKQRR